MRNNDNDSLIQVRRDPPRRANRSEHKIVNLLGSLLIDQLPIDQNDDGLEEPVEG